MKFYRPPNMRQCTKPWENNCTGAASSYLRYKWWKNKPQPFDYAHHASLNNFYQHTLHHIFQYLCT